MPGRPARMRRSDGCKPPSSESISAKPGDEAGNPAAARLRLFRQFHGAAQAFGEIERAVAVFRAFADAIERLFRLLDLRLRRLVVRRFIGGIDHVLADADQRTAHGEIVQDARIVAHIRQRGRGLRETDEIGVAADFLQARDRPSSPRAASAASAPCRRAPATRPSPRRGADAADRRNAPASGAPSPPRARDCPPGSHRAAPARLRCRRGRGGRLPVPCAFWLSKGGGSDATRPANQSRGRTAASNIPIHAQPNNSVGT